MSTRRQVIKTILTSFLGITTYLSISNQTTPRKNKKVVWVRLTNEPVGVGDFWASTDPNTPERQGENTYNLQMQAAHPNNYGVAADKIGRGNGDYWRPHGLV